MISESSPQINSHAEARVRVEADVVNALDESFTRNADKVQLLDNGIEHLELYVQPYGDSVAKVEVDRQPEDEQGDRTTIMKLIPIARSSDSGHLKGIQLGNGRTHANVWRLTETVGQAPRFETGRINEAGDFEFFDDDLMNHDETVAGFGGYWPANLRQGVPENPLRKSRGLSRLAGGVVLRSALPRLDHQDFYHNDSKEQ